MGNTQTKSDPTMIFGGLGFIGKNISFKFIADSTSFYLNRPIGGSLVPQFTLNDEKFHRILSVPQIHRYGSE